MNQTTSAPVDERLIELGWFVVSDLDSEEMQILARVREQMLERVNELFPQFDWRLTLITRPLPLQQNPSEASMLLQEGLMEQDARGWDFTFVVTHADLTTYYKPYAFAVPSRALSVAVVSLARLLSTQVGRTTASDDKRRANRLCHLFLHLLGDLNGIEHRSSPEDYMYEPGEMSDLDAMSDFAPDTRSGLAAELENVADTRLEERPQADTTGVLWFYCQAIWLLRGDIVSAVWQAQPWQFPFQLNRLTTGAVSTLLILMMTAEAWDLGMRQSLPLMIVFSLFVLAGTSAFILQRQKLLLRRSQRRLSEQVVLTNASISLVVFFGMATTYLLLLALTLILGQVLFSEKLVADWAATLAEPIQFSHYLTLGQLTASLGILIGSLGASFEGQHYFRHIAYVDEEL